MAGCNHDCSNCSSKCEKADFTIHTNDRSKIRKVYGIVSGKGGVGKSSVTSMLAVTSARIGYKTAILDGDILGPSIPKMFNVTQKAYGDKDGKHILPAKAGLDIDLISSAMLLENETDPVIWRGSLVSNIVKQFYSDVIYGEQDVLFIDMPPGTGDVSLTVFQSIPLDGIIIVTSPQSLVRTIVAKACNMANMMNVPIVALVENYSYVKCPNCNEIINVFGDSKANDVACEYGISNVITLPLDKNIATLCDTGNITNYNEDYFTNLVMELMK